LLKLAGAHYISFRHPQPSMAKHAPISALLLAHSFSS